MSSNSRNKNIIRTTESTSLGAGRVDLSKANFDKLVEDKGYDVIIDKSIKCPCRSLGNNQALSDCRNCGGSGYVYLNRYGSKMIIQSMNLNTRYREWSEEKLGKAGMTAKSEDELTFMDRITVTSGLSIHIQTVRTVKYENQLRGRLIYPPIEIDEFFAFVGSDQRLRMLTFGTDYTLDGNIITFSSEFFDVNDFTVSVRYKHYPVYHIIDLPREVMESHVLSNGEDQSMKFPIHAIGRRAHYVLDEENFSGTFLLDNSYTESCNPIVIQDNIICD